MDRCRHCGVEVKDERELCPECGLPLASTRPRFFATAARFLNSAPAWRILSVSTLMLGIVYGLACVACLVLARRAYSAEQSAWFYRGAFWDFLLAATVLAARFVLTPVRRGDLILARILLVTAFAINLSLWIGKRNWIEAVLTWPVLLYPLVWSLAVKRVW